MIKLLLALCLLNDKIIIIASRDDDGGWYDYSQWQKCIIERDDV